jgi:RNA polymerase sigma factor (TIGR02999 family)
VPSADVTVLLRAWADGDASALDRLVPLVYRELHKIARTCVAGERAGHSLQPTALIHEAYLRLSGVTRIQWQDRAHFFAMSAKMMRRILVDIARSKRSAKRGAGAARESLDGALALTDERSPDLVALDLALQALTRIDERKGRVVELRFFGGFSVQETAAALDVSEETIHRDWRFAKSWLRRELRGRSSDGP